MTRDDLQRIGDNAHVGMAAHGKNALTGGLVDRLPPRLWDALRVELQRRYRNATGEEFAVLAVESSQGRQQAAERATPEEIAAAWATWHSRHGGKLGPGPAFVEAINAAFAAREKRSTNG